MINRRPRGNALTFALIVGAIMATVAFAATMLLPYASADLDDHLTQARLQSAADSALEEALANLNAGRSPEFSRRIDSAEVNVKKTSENADAMGLTFDCRAPGQSATSRDGEWKALATISLAKIARGVWRVRQYKRTTELLGRAY